MKRTSTLSTAAVIILLMVVVVDARAQESRRPKAPALTNDDISTPGTARSIPEDHITRTGPSGAALRNAGAVLESAMTKMAEVKSVRIRMQSSLPAGQREILMESVKPDRAHIISPESEMFVIGNKLYSKSGGGSWQVTSMSAGAQSNLGLDFRKFVKEMTGKAGVRITGNVLGDQTIDGVDTVAYEFGVADGAETGTIQISVGKEDGYMRRMSFSQGAIGIKVWFSEINEPFSIEPPM